VARDLHAVRHVNAHQQQAAAMITTSKRTWMSMLIACTLLADAGAQRVSEPALEPAHRAFAERLAGYDRAAHDAWCQVVVFAPPVDEFFRQRVHEALGPAERLLLAAADEGLDTLPPRLLQYLPDLPRGIEYRLVQADLVLWDVDAEIIIDVLPDALR
jgi:hypothetical protein